MQGGRVGDLFDLEELAILAARRGLRFVPYQLSSGSRLIGAGLTMIGVYCVTRSSRVKWIGELNGLCRLGFKGNA